MKQQERAEMEARLDETARRWKTLPAEGNEAVIRKLENEIGCLCVELYAGNLYDEDAIQNTTFQGDAFQSTFGEVFSKYDPTKGDGSFCHYFSFLMNRRKNDLLKEKLKSVKDKEVLLYGGVQNKAKDKDEEKEDGKMWPERSKAKGAVHSFSDSDTAQSDNGQTDNMENDFIAGSATGEVIDQFVVVDQLDELTAMIQNFFQRRGREGNETRRLWFRLFYTEDMTYIFKDCRYRLRHERDAFSAMLLPYLDYYMSAPCRTQREVFQTPLKAYGEVVPEKEGETGETPLPLPAEVSLSYLRLQEGKQVGNSARSNQMKFYKQMKKESYPC